MNISQLAVRRPVATGTILCLVLLIGLVSLYQSPLDLLPDIQAPVLAVITVFPGSSPQETLELVTKPIENGVAAVSGLTEITSYSQENMSIVIMMFDWDADIRRLREDINVRLDLISFPDGVQRPILLEFDPSLMPIMQISASGGNDAVKLTEWLQETASPRLESVLGVASVQVQGGAKQDLFIRTSPDIMAEYEVSFEQIANVLRASLVDFPAGIIELDDRQVRIRFLGRYAEPELLPDLIVGFQVDQEALEKMIGQEIDINLNRMLTDQTDLFSGTGRSGSSAVPMREIYWNDIIDFEQAVLADSNLYLPIQDEWLFQNDADIDNFLHLLSVNPGLTYRPEFQSLIFSLDLAGNIPVQPAIGTPGTNSVRLEDLWLLDRAVWQNGLIIIPLDQTSVKHHEVTAAQLTAVADTYPLIVQASPNQLLVAFHEQWATMESEPIATIPDYGSWLANIQGDINRGIGDTTRMLEDGLTEMATAMILNSMLPGNSAMAGFDIGDDFPIHPVSLGMLADISQDIYNPSTITRYNRQPSIGLSIQKEGDANTVLVARQVRDTLDKLSEESAGSFSQVVFSTVFDQAEEIERALADLAWSLAGGAALAILVLLLFLRNWRTTMFIGLSIPVAIVATFTLLYFTNITINLMTLGGLALAAGMLVDNAIVVSENIFRHYQMGKTPADSAVDGAKEVAGAITASTLTTISVFFPVVFLSGLAGQLFWEFALTVACAILASLLVALTVIPLLASRSLRQSADKQDSGIKLYRLPGYRKLLKLVVGHPWPVIIFAIVFISIGVGGYFTLGTELFPSPEESSFSININLPPGSILSKTDHYVREVEDILAERDEISYFSTRIGGSSFMGIIGESGVSNQARIRAQVDSRSVQEIDRLIEEIRSEVKLLPGAVEVSFIRESLLDAAGLDTRLDLVIIGESLEQVKLITAQAEDLLSTNPHFPDIQSSLEENRPEIHIRLDQGKALQKGVTVFTVATAVRQALEGIPVSRIETESGILDIILGYQQAELNTIEDIGRIGFYTPAGEYVQLDQLATLSEAFGPQSIPRENQQIVSQIQVQYSGIDLGSATSQALEALGSLDLPDGYEIKPAGSSTLMGDVLSELQMVLIVAALLVYLVMAAQFESLLHPFIIICSLPLAFVGAVAALIITGHSVSIPAMIGVVVLSGILVNDGIIMVDFINQQHRLHGLRLKEAIVEGATARLRPILMTTATTVLGLLPLSMGFGEGSQLQAPMALTIIGGQITGTLLLLVVIPAIYLLVTREKAVEPVKLEAGASRRKVSSSETVIHYAGNSSPRGAVDDHTGSRQHRPLLLRVIIVLILAVVIYLLINFFNQGMVTVIH